MKKNLSAFVIFTLCIFLANAQPWQIISDSVVPLPCGQQCTTLHATAIGGPITTNNYIIDSIPFTPPCSFSGGTVVTIANPASNQFSGIINLPFSFCFYGKGYNQLVISENSFITFTAQASEFSYIPGPVPQSIQNQSYNSLWNSIFAAWQPLDLSYEGSIRTNTGGNSPNRYFAVIWDSVPIYGGGNSNLTYCDSAYYETQMIVLYENSNVIDIYIKQKDTICSDQLYNMDNGILSLEGVVNANSTAAVTVAGRNATQWTATNDARRFTPSGTAVTSFSWYLLGQQHVDTDSILSITDSITVCPDTTTNYIIKAAYLTCGDTLFTLSDTVQVFLSIPHVTPSVYITGDSFLCSSAPTIFAANGNNGGDSAVYQWQVNGHAEGIDSDIFIYPAPASGDIISCSYISNAVCASPAVVNSNKVTITIDEAPVVWLCLVTSDTSGPGNIVVWDSPPYESSVDSIYIYRSDSTFSTYQQIAAFSANAPDGFFDTMANVDQNSYRYEINVSDTCGNYSALSPYQQTIHLRYTGGGFFEWTAYIAPNSQVYQYNLCIDTFGTNNWVVRDSVNGVTTSLFEVGSSDFAHARYKIEALYPPEYCYAGPTDIMAITSNAVTVNNILGVSTLEESDITIIPNPTHNQFEIINKNTACLVRSLTIIDQLGNNLHPSYTLGPDGNLSVDVTTMAPGLYYAILNSECRSLIQKVVKY